MVADLPPLGCVEFEGHLRSHDGDKLSLFLLDCKRKSHAFSSILYFRPEPGRVHAPFDLGQFRERAGRFDLGLESAIRFDDSQTLRVLICKIGT